MNYNRKELLTSDTEFFKTDMSLRYEEDKCKKEIGTLLFSSKICFPIKIPFIIGYKLYTTIIPILILCICGVYLIVV